MEIIHHWTGYDVELNVYYCILKIAYQALKGIGNKKFYCFSWKSMKK
jgi:hypothetical protein